MSLFWASTFNWVSSEPCWAKQYLWYEHSGSFMSSSCVPVRATEPFYFMTTILSHCLNDPILKATMTTVNELPWAL